MGTLENSASMPKVSTAKERKSELRSPRKIKDSQQNNYKEAMSLQLDCLHKRQLLCSVIVNKGQIKEGDSYIFTKL